MLKNAKKEDLYWCPHRNCSRSYDDKGSLLEHYRVDHCDAKDTLSLKKEPRETSSTAPGAEKSKGTEFSQESATSVAMSENEEHNLTVAACLGKDEKYHCPYKMCLKSYRRIDALRHHYRAEHLGKRYSCPRCGIQFKLPSGLSTHKGKCKAPIKTKLNEVTKKEKQDVAHSVLQTIEDTSPGKDGQYQCKKKGCDACFPDKITLTDHYRAKHLGMLHSCPNCHQQFSHRTNLAMHKKICMNDKVKSDIHHITQTIKQLGPGLDRRYHCPKKSCEASYAHQKALVVHYRVKHLRVLYPCPKCPHQSTDGGNLAKHKRICRGAKVKPAGVNGEDVPGLQSEADIKNAMETIRHVACGGDNRLHCPDETCDASYTDRRMLIDHYRVNHVGLLYSCQKCHRQFSYRTNLRIHMLNCVNVKVKSSRVDTENKQAHLGRDKRYHCPKESCNASYSEKRHLEKHFRVKHSGIVYSCPKCHYWFSNSPTLGKHKQVCTGVEVQTGEDVKMVGIIGEIKQTGPMKDGCFQCPFDSCSSAFTHKADVYRHYRINHLGIRFSCNNCSVKFEGQSKLERHQQNCKGNDPRSNGKNPLLTQSVSCIECMVQVVNGKIWFSRTGYECWSENFRICLQ